MLTGHGYFSRKTLIAGVLFGLAGFVLYMVEVPLFFSIHLFFGSVAVMIALLACGPEVGLIASVVTSIHTVIKWNHPWMMVILVGETIFVSLLLRRSRNIVLLSTIYWLLIGMPVTMVTQNIFLGTTNSLSTLLALKHGINGILNSLLAALVVYAVTLVAGRHKRPDLLPTMHHVLATMVVAAILIPGVGYVILDIRRDLGHEEKIVRDRLVSATDLSRDLVETWLGDKIRSVETLASLVGDPQVVPAEAVQATADQLKKVAPYFLTMSVQNINAVSVAFVPQFNDMGMSNVGRDYSKFPYHSMLRETLRPVVSDVDFGSVVRGPRVALFAPIVRDGLFRGYCTGVIELNWLKKQLSIISGNTGTDITLLDRKNRVIASTDINMRINDQFEPRGGGEFQWLGEKTYQILPKVPTTSTVRRWQAGSFGMDRVVSGDIQWLVVVRAPMKPYVTSIYHNGSRGFAMLLVLTAFSIIAAQAANAAFVRPVARLEAVSAALPTELVRHDQLDWPESGVREVAALIGNIREMARTLNGYVFELQSLNESLEQRVSDRTEELRRSEERLRTIFSSAGVGIILCNGERRIIDCNPATERFLCYSRRELIGKDIADISHPADDMHNLDLVQQILADGTDTFSMEKRYIRKDGSPVWGSLTLSIIRGEEGAIDYTIAMVEDIHDRKQAEQEVRQLAYFDSLTGLPNRTLLQDRLNQALAAGAREQRSVALLFLDLDRFKDVNDTMGHACGDQLLTSVAQRLLASVRKSDTLARIGGDEFVIILNSQAEEANVTAAAQHILDRMNEPFLIEGKEIFISTSIGIVLYPGDGNDAETLLKHADMALYAAKETGRNAYNFFSQEMNRKALYRKKMEEGLRHALAHDELFLQYQPLVDIRSGQAIGVEALLRWNHPDEGLIGPDVFIPVAEETGMIRRIGEWVLQKACIQAREWKDLGMRRLQVAVNVSGYQFNAPDFIPIVDRVLRETGVDPRWIELELTETTLMEGRGETLMTLAHLKKLGIRLAIDDFGTGYSSLSYLKHFPIDRVKIDRTFVHDILASSDDRAIVEAIIAMSHTLGLRVVAEGVEHESELALLRELGCDDAQGFLFARPLLPREVEEILLGDVTYGNAAS